MHGRGDDITHNVVFIEVNNDAATATRACVALFCCGRKNLKNVAFLPQSCVIHFSFIKSRLRECCSFRKR